VLGAPLGTALGAALDWRATLWLVTALGGLAGVVIALRLPALRRAAAATGLRRFAPLTDGRVRTLLACTFVAFLGIYLPYTYFSAVYEPSTAGSGARLAVLLFVFGAAGTVGNILAGNLADRFGPRRVIVVVTLLLAVVLAALPLFQGSMLVAVPAAFVCGVLSFAITTPQQQLIITYAPTAGPVITSLYQSVLYLAISASGAVGALVLAGWGAAPIGPVAGVLVLVAALLTGLSGRAREPRGSRYPTAT
ncbi:MAG: MFS transporter, partial [Pseudonocardia sp.]